MKIALAQLNFIVGDLDYNSNLILKELKKAQAENVDLLIFSEMSICGYPPLDLLTYDGFINECMEKVSAIAAQCQGISVILGGPSFNENPKGKRLRNTAFVIENGEITHQIHKTLLPDYDVFDEYRYFEPNKNFNHLVTIGKLKFAITICEDIWDIHESNYYEQGVLSELDLSDVDYIVNIAASPFSHQQWNEREKVRKPIAEKYQKPFIYVNQSGTQTDLIFDGNSKVLDADGKIRLLLPAFESGVRQFETEALQDLPTIDSKPNKIKNIHDALISGIRDYFGKMKFEKALIGLSGGIDSGLTLALACEALGSENVTAVMLPSKYTSVASLDDALKLTENLECNYKTISIKEVNKLVNDTLSPHFFNTPPDITEENIQSRIRGILLMAISNKFGHLLLNTTNKSEMAVGYGTLYGDLCGSISILGDLYKTEVYDLARYLNRQEAVIPPNMITKAPTAELKEEQKDTDSLPDYPILDQILHAFIEEQKSKKTIVAETKLAEDLVEKVIRLVHQSEYKRFQTAPCLRVSSKSFGYSRKIPLVSGKSYW